MAFSLSNSRRGRFVSLFVLFVVCAVAPAQAGEGVWTASGPPGTVTAISPGKNGHAYAITSSGLYQSIDAGESWARVGPAPLCSPGSTLFLDDVYQDLLYSAGNGVCRTEFGGFEWIQASGLPQTASGVRAVAGGRGIVFALGRDLGLSWSYDFGLTFESIPIPFQEPLSLAVDPNSRAHIYVGTAAGQIFRSLNVGRSWTPIGKGLPAAPILDLAAVQLGPYVQPPILYAAIAGNGLYRSVDGGETWAASSAGLPAGDVFSRAAVSSEASMEARRGFPSPPDCHRRASGRFNRARRAGFSSRCRRPERELSSIACRTPRSRRPDPPGRSSPTALRTSR